MQDLARPIATCVFLHSPSEAPDARAVVRRMPDFELLGERALLLARPGDIVCLAQTVDPRYLAFLRSLEIGPQAEDVLVVDGVVPGEGVSARLIDDRPALERLAGRLRGSGPVVLSPFFTTTATEALRDALRLRLGRPVEVVGGPSALVRRVHEKRFARGLAESLGVPVSPGDLVTVPRPAERGPGDLTELRHSMERWSQMTGRVIVRGSSGASGSSTFTTGPGEIDAAVDALARRADNTDYLVQPLFPATVSPNVEVVVDSGSPVSPRVAVTDQVLDPELVYQGSAHPSRARRLSDMTADSLAVAGWMRQRGFVGRVGFDFVEHDFTKDSRPGYFLTEINPRLNGASYPLAVTARLAALASRRATPAPTAFLTSTVRVRFRDFAGIERHWEPLLYDPARGEGVIPYSVAALAFGKVGIAAFAATRERADEIFDELISRANALGGMSIRATP